MATPIRPDREFIQDVLKNGGDSAKKCFQCANCTAVCELASKDALFPRRQMHMAQWGMKEKLAADPSVWYCHQCKDCSTHCPRNAKPADTLSAIRLALIKSYAVPSFMGKIMSEAKYLWAVFAIPVVFMLFMLGIAGSFKFPEGHVHYAAWLPHIVIEIMFSLAVFLGIGGAIAGGMKFWKAIDKSVKGNDEKKESLVIALINTAKELLIHARFRKCGNDRTFSFIHMLIFFGFVGLFITTSFVVLFVILKFPYPLDITHPLKIFGNLSAASLLIGLIWAIIRRLNVPDTENKGSYPDWLLLFVLLGVVVTGLITQVLRFADIAAIAYPSYFIHMVFNFILLVFLPYSKFAHIFYRFLAILHGRLKGVDLGDLTEETVAAPAPAEEAAQEA